MWLNRNALKKNKKHNNKNKNKMFIKTITSLALCSLFSTINAQNIKFSNEIIDAGQVSYRIPTTVTYEFVNNGTKPLVIEDIKASCGCIKVDYPKNAIAPKSKGHIRAVFDAAQLGHFAKQFIVYSNGSNKPILLMYKGIVVSKIQNFSGNYDTKIGLLSADTNNIEFDDVNIGEMPQQKIHIKNNTKKTIQPVLMHLPNYIKASVSPSKLAPNESGIIVITLDARALRRLGLTQTPVYVGMFPGDKVTQDKEINISAVLLPSFDKLSEEQLKNAPKIELSKNEINLNETEGKNKKKIEIDIKNTGLSTLDISSIQMFTMGLRLSLNKTKLKPNESTTLKIVADVNALKQAKSRPRILLITNDPNNAKVVVNINIK